MWTIHATREIDFHGAALGVSAARLWDHTQLHQINPLAPITKQAALCPEAYVDVSSRTGGVRQITGLRLQDLREKRFGNLHPNDVAQLLRNLECREYKQWIDSVQAHLQRASRHRASRNVPEPFLPAGGTSPLGVAGLHCALRSWLAAHRDEVAPAEQWRNRIEKLTQRGLRRDELELSAFTETDRWPNGRSLGGNELLQRLDYQDVRISIVPVLAPASRQLQFTRVANGLPIKRKQPRQRRPLQASPAYRDPVMGYWVDRIQWDDLFRSDPGWRALTAHGEVVTSERNPTGICLSADEAMNLASAHANTVLPKLTTQGKWSRYAVSGGEHYREWLVTLPHYRFSYYSPHFPHRNVLLHLRCDIRRDPDGHRVLLIQEVQSDWAQALKRAGRAGDAASIPPPPWAQEWPALALKLMLLHAAARNIDGVAWTTGTMQARRYGGHGQKWLHRLYDEILANEASRLLRRHDVRVERMRIRVPVNFSIRPAEIGYEVLDETGRSMGVALTWEAARALLPDGSQERWVDMHGIRLGSSLRAAIRQDGFFAWGHGFASPSDGQ